jgi:hypothetical protein
MVLAATNHLYDDVAALRTRIRALEGALGKVHFDRTGATHPLLVPRPEDDRDDDDILGPESSLDIDKQEAIDDTDTLAIGRDGSRRFFGSVGSALVHALTVCNSVRHAIGTWLIRSCRTMKYPWTDKHIRMKTLN